jgi:uncharacterized protein YecT (DUF1311 family)
MRMRHFAVCSAAVLLFLLPAAGAFAVEPPTEDVVAVKTCTDLAAANEKSRPLHAEDELEEKPGAVGRLAAASEAARRAPLSCVGVLSTACIQKQGNMADSVQIACRMRETAVWDKRLNAAFRKASSRMESEALDNLRKVQRAWIAWRDASCRQSYLVFQGSMAGPMEAWCEMDITARQAIWMEGWVE